jgi:mannose-6-phosphate isomerase
MSSAGAPTRTPVVSLVPEPVVRVWGRLQPGKWSCGLTAPAGIDGNCTGGNRIGGNRIGELHHKLPADARQISGADALLVKTLFTDALLSVQVHPDAATARALGMACGKDEAWLVLEAEPGAVIGLGLREAMTAEALAAAVADGSVIDAMLWHTVTAGDVLFAPAGAVHAIGAGVTVLEVQENNDVTWRLYDHGRGRRLDLAEGLQVARREAFVAPAPHAPPAPGRDLLVAGGGFVLERVAGAGVLAPAPGRPVWAAAVSDGVVIDGVRLMLGAVALVAEAVAVSAADGLMLAQAGPSAQPGLWEQH